MPVPLPSDVADHHLDLEASKAYNVCRGFEQRAGAATKDSALKIMHARILGYLIIHSPSDTARDEVAKSINSCDNDEALSALGSMFLDYYIRPFKKYRGRTPNGSSHPSRPSFDETKKKMLEEAPNTHPKAKARALVRDGYHCLATRLYDVLVESDPEIILDEEAMAHKVYTECAHIVPDSTYFKVSPNTSVKRDYAASVLAVLKRFGYDVDNLNGEKVHSLFNVMTLEKNVHDMFDRLELWFDATTTENCYRIQTTRPFFMVQQGDVVFTTHDPVNFPLPSPRLLALHAACARVAHLSGAGEYVDKSFEDMDDMDVLAPDGTSSEVLHNALMTLGSKPIAIGVF